MTNQITKPKSKGKIKPQALPLEEAILGAIMLDKDAFIIIVDMLHKEIFYKDAHQLIYAAFLRLFNKNQPIDLLTVTEELKKTGDLGLAGGPHYLVGLTNRVASAANIEYHARLIIQKALKRNIIEMGVSAMKDGYNDMVDAFALLDNVEKKLGDIVTGISSRSYQKLGDAMPTFMKRLETLNKNKQQGLTGVPSGFTELDRMTAGWQQDDFIIMAARPGMGKTALTVAMALNAAQDYGKGVAFFSLEMSVQQVVGRLVSLEGEISGSKIRTGELEDYEWQVLGNVIEKMAEVPIFIDDTPGISIYELRAKCRRLKMQHDIQMVIIDYLQLMSGGADYKGKGNNREQEISFISRSCKELAKELNVPVIALSQLSRAVETRGGMKRPQLSDLRESGSLEQDADIVSFIYRPEYYQILEDEEGQSLKGMGEVIIAKHRNGALGTVKLKFIDKFAKFTDFDDMGFDDLPDDEDDDMGIVDDKDNPMSPDFMMPSKGELMTGYGAINKRPSENDLSSLM